MFKVQVEPLEKSFDSLRLRPSDSSLLVLDSMNQVTPSLFIGDDDAAADYEALKDKKITHIINLATGVDNYFPNVGLSSSLRLGADLIGLQVS